MNAPVALVTGASGFVGGNLVRALHEQGQRVVALLRPGSSRGRQQGLQLSAWSELATLELHDEVALRDLLRQYRPTTIYHLAADAIVRAEQASNGYPDNIAVTRILLDAVERETPAACLLLASSEAVYAASGDIMLAETTPPLAQSGYGLAKVECERLMQALAMRSSVRTCVARLCNIYGSGDDNLTRIIPGAIVAVLRGRQPELRSDPSTCRDFLHIDDAIRGMQTIVSALPVADEACAVFNLASGHAISLGEVVQRIVTLGGRPELMPSNLLNWAPPRAPRSRIVVAKAWKLLGWRAQIELDTGLQRSFDWYCEHRHRFEER